MRPFMVETPIEEMTSSFRVAREDWHAVGHGDWLM
jgi:hypothetical protein